ncbi:glycosyltransferase family 2 protein [Marinibacterium profundimaris]|uniref:glycosyltransferase family 2 protein n=1 Tax=Marinibacterium profundimaris TaxID=1679460 RepID=UPI001E299A47|nr:glycosyltransferase family 2 protein [Marinibacterium profundimaris]
MPPSAQGHRTRPRVDSPPSLSISIVTAVFNRRDTIGQALDSVAAQSFAAAEHLVQDGLSRDGTAEVVLRRRDARIRLVSEPDTGIYDAINRAIARSRGEIIGLLHSDDVFASARVLSRVADALSDPAVDGVYGDLDYVSAADPGRILRRWRSGDWSPDRLARGWMPPHPTLFLRRRVYERYGLYDPGYRISGDYDAMLRYLTRGHIRLAYIPEVLVRMRTGGASNGSLGRILRKSREDYRAIRSNGVGGLRTLVMKNTTKLRQFL